ncbi:conserved hypothetical protein [delta proteobacterium NaphS2]|nr:conserved hypothetical protein [delta proteobacterium NaphS2]
MGFSRSSVAARLKRNVGAPGDKRIERMATGHSASRKDKYE